MTGFSNTLEIRDRYIGDGHRPYIIAEMACAHDGKLAKAKQLVDSAVEAGADAVQFEMLDPDDNVVPGTDMYDLLKRLQFNQDQWHELFEYTRRNDIAIFNFAYDPASLKLGFELEADAVKLNSSDLTHTDMLIDIAKSGLVCTLGTGASTFDEISEALEIISKHGGTKLVLMQGVQSFPTSHEHARINRMCELHKLFGCLVGYADHTSGDSDLAKVVDLVAIGAGASVLEKHITLDRKKKGIDYESALEPPEFNNWVKLTREAAETLGQSSLKPLSEMDYQYRLFQKKTIIAARDINCGETISRDKVRFLRNMKTHGLSPVKFPSIDGVEVIRDIRKFEQIQLSDLKTKA